MGNCHDSSMCTECAEQEAYQTYLTLDQLADEADAAYMGALENEADYFELARLNMLSIKAYAASRGASAAHDYIQRRVIE